MRHVVIAALLAACLACEDPASGDPAQAQYWVQSAVEGMPPPVRRVRIAADATEMHDGCAYRWWEMSMERPDGFALGIRVLSEHVPLTDDGARGVGRILRYLYCAPSGQRAVEYVDQQTGAALLPSFPGFLSECLPTAFSATRMTHGFANTGRLLGHALVRSNIGPDFPTLDFSDPLLLRLRSDLRIGSQSDTRDDRDESIPIDQREHTPLTRDEYMEMIDAGANFFHPSQQAVEWLKNEAVFWSGPGVYPDDMYRSNFEPGRMFIDEPAIRFGWNDWIPSNTMGPEIFANAITTRLAAYERPLERAAVAPAGFSPGAMEFLHAPMPVWETLFSTAWYQMLAGASGVVHEGRYNRRGYGWVPEMLLGEGLEGLTDRQQLDYFNSFLRGAARRFDAWWGVSVYPEGDRSMMVPAFTRAYDQGARAFWFWNDRNLPYRWRLQVLRGLKEHIQSHPRPSATKAEAAVVLPAGFIPREDGIFGVNPEELTQEGASYADISAAALFHGILLSQQGVEYDSIFAETPDSVEHMGYSRLVVVREDGSVEFRPSRRSRAIPEGLRIDVNREVNRHGADARGEHLTLEELRPGLSASPVDDASPQRGSAREPHPIRDIGTISIDAALGDWSKAEWTTLEDEPHLFGDNWRESVDLVVPADAAPGLPQEFLGFTWDGISRDYRTKYRLEGHTLDEVVVTGVKKGSAAEEAGLREGDVILQIDEKRIRWPFEVWGKVDQLKRQPGNTAHIEIRRGGLDHYRGRDDLSARVALAMDSRFIYLAADVADDLHTQTRRPPEFWRNDCVQIGIDPLGTGSAGYAPHGHEIGLALTTEGPVAYRWAGRRGQPVSIMNEVSTAISRRGNRTIYEAAIPLTSLGPLSPRITPVIGLSVVINDSDDSRQRKARLELDPGAMTAGKNLGQFSRFRLEPAEQPEVSAYLLWDRTCLKSGGAAELTLAAASQQPGPATVTAELSSLDDPDAEAIHAQSRVDLTAEVAFYKLRMVTRSSPGRYRLDVTVRDSHGDTATRDALPVFIYR